MRIEKKLEGREGWVRQLGMRESVERVCEGELYGGERKMIKNE